MLFLAKRYLWIMMALISCECFADIPNAFELVKDNALSEIKALVKNKQIHLDVIDAKGKTLLHYANTLEMGILLVEAGVKIDVLDNNGRSAADALYVWSTDNNFKNLCINEDLLGYLLERGCSLNSPPDDVQRRFIALVDEHLAMGGDLYSPMPKLRAPMFAAIAHKFDQAIEYMLKQGFDVHKKGYIARDGSYFDEVLIWGDAKALKLFYKYGLNTDRVIPTHIDPIIYAANLTNDPEILKVIYDNGSKKYIDEMVDLYGKGNLLHRYVKNGTAVVLVEFLAEIGFDPKYINAEGKSLIHTAVEHQRPYYIDVLIKKYKLDINVRDSKGKTPLHLAVEKNNFDMVRLLLDYKADSIIKDEKNMSPYDIAVERQYNEIAEFLLKAVP